MCSGAGRLRLGWEAAVHTRRGGHGNKSGGPSCLASVLRHRGRGSPRWRLRLHQGHSFTQCVHTYLQLHPTTSLHRHAITHSIHTYQVHILHTSQIHNPHISHTHHTQHTVQMSLQSRLHWGSFLTSPPLLPVLSLPSEYLALNPYSPSPGSRVTGVPVALAA